MTLSLPLPAKITHFERHGSALRPDGNQMRVSSSPVPAWSTLLQDSGNVQRFCSTHGGAADSALPTDTKPCESLGHSTRATWSDRPWASKSCPPRGFLADPERASIPTTCSMSRVSTQSLSGWLPRFHPRDSPVPVGEGTPFFRSSSSAHLPSPPQESSLDASQNSRRGPHQQQVVQAQHRDANRSTLDVPGAERNLTATSPHCGMMHAKSSLKPWWLRHPFKMSIQPPMRDVNAAGNALESRLPPLCEARPPEATDADRALMSATVSLASSASLPTVTAAVAEDHLFRNHQQEALEEQAVWVPPSVPLASGAACATCKASLWMPHTTCTCTHTPFYATNSSLPGVGSTCRTRGDCWPNLCALDISSQRLSTIAPVPPWPEAPKVHHAGAPSPRSVPVGSQMHADVGSGSCQVAVPPVAIRPALHVPLKWNNCTVDAVAPLDIPRDLNSAFQLLPRAPTPTARSQALVLPAWSAVGKDTHARQSIHLGWEQTGIVMADLDARAESCTYDCHASRTACQECSSLADQSASTSSAPAGPGCSSTGFLLTATCPAPTAPPPKGILFCCLGCKPNVASDVHRGLGPQAGTVTKACAERHRSCSSQASPAKQDAVHMHTRPVAEGHRSGITRMSYSASQNRIGQVLQTQSEWNSQISLHGSATSFSVASSSFKRRSTALTMLHTKSRSVPHCIQAASVPRLLLQPHVSPELRGLDVLLEPVSHWAVPVLVVANSQQSLVSACQQRQLEQSAMPQDSSTRIRPLTEVSTREGIAERLQTRVTGALAAMQRLVATGRATTLLPVDEVWPQVAEYNGVRVLQDRGLESKHALAFFVEVRLYLSFALLQVASTSAL
jgi:hypothetical protein